MKSLHTFLLTFLLSFNFSFASHNVQLERIEPPFWWSGMQNDHLQLLVYGENIALARPSLEYPGVNIRQVSFVENDNYLFIDLIISDRAKPGKFEIWFEHEGSTVQSYTYELKVRRKNAAMIKGFNTEDIIYLITPDRFANGDEQNDYVDGLREKPNREEPYGRHGGDIRGLINHLDYIQDLGFSCVWLNPVLENDQAEQSYHGYATTDFYKVDPRFGSNEEYVELSKRLEGRGMKLIMDMIANHCGSEHWWIKDLPTKDWLNDGGSAFYSNHRKETLLDPYGSKNERQQMVNGWFAQTMPDLNQKNPWLATYLIQNSIWWVEYANLSGIRQDTYSYPDPQFMADWTCALQNEYPYLNIVAEEWVDDPAMVSYWQQGKVNVDGYTSCLPSVMDFPLNFAIRKGIPAKDEWGTGLVDLYRVLCKDYVYANSENLVIFPDNHDMSRIYTVLNEDQNLLKIALAFTLTTRGIPQIYYGTEILMSNPGTESHGIIRSDYPGGWKGDTINAFTGEGLSQDARNMRAYLKKLMQWRNLEKVIHKGKMMHFIPKDGKYVYFRYTNEKAIMIVLNKGGQKDSIDTNYYYEITGDYSKAKNILTGTETPLGMEFKLDGDPVGIYELLR